MKLDICHYAKRQWTWWRAQQNTHWLNGFGFDQVIIDKAEKIAAELYGDHRN